MKAYHEIQKLDQRFLGLLMGWAARSTSFASGDPLGRPLGDDWIQFDPNRFNILPFI